MLSYLVVGAAESLHVIGSVIFFICDSGIPVHNVRNMMIFTHSKLILTIDLRKRLFRADSEDISEQF